jgi:hypothetical protein
VAPNDALPDAPAPPSLLRPAAPADTPSSRPAPRPGFAPAQAADSAFTEAVGRAAGTLFAGISKLRGAKSLHPKGVTHAATLTLRGAPDAPGFLGEEGEHPALVRFSRSIGLPETLPDLLGVAIRLTDVHGPGRHQDFLLVTSLDIPVLHHIFVPVYSRQARPYSSSLPYEDEAGTKFLVGLLPTGDPQRFELAIASVLGRFKAVGDLRVGEALPDDYEGVHFNPFNTGGRIEPTSWLNRLRDYAYPRSQAGWDGQ